MSRAIGSGILVNICLVTCRARFFRSVFTGTRQRGTMLLISCLSSALLASFPTIATVTGRDALHYTAIGSINGSARLLLLVALSIIPLFTYIIIRHFPTRLSAQIIGIFIILGGGVSILVVTFPSVTLILWLLIAIIEERTKTTTTLACHDRFARMSSDIIFFGLISALGFAFIENCIYLWNLGDTTIHYASTLVIKRTLTSRIMHISYTGLITLGITTLATTPKQRYRGVLLIGSGILVHTLFNVVLHTAHLGITFLVIISGYLFLSWLIYKSERVYIS